MWKRNRCKVYSTNVHINIPVPTIIATSGSVCPFWIDMVTKKNTTGSQMVGTAHHTVRVKNWKFKMQGC